MFISTLFVPQPVLAAALGPLAHPNSSARSRIAAYGASEGLTIGKLPLGKMPLGKYLTSINSIMIWLNFTPLFGLTLYLSQLYIYIYSMSQLSLYSMVNIYSVWHNVQLKKDWFAYNCSSKKIHPSPLPPVPFCNP